MIKKLLVFVALLLVPSLSSAQSNRQDSDRQRYEITISNPNPFAMQQVLEIDTAGVLHGLGIGKDAPFRILNAAGQELGTQITYDGKLLVYASVRNTSIIPLLSVFEILSSVKVSGSRCMSCFILIDSA